MKWVWDVWLVDADGVRWVHFDHGECDTWKAAYVTARAKVGFHTMTQRRDIMTFAGSVRKARG